MYEITNKQIFVGIIVEFRVETAVDVGPNVAIIGEFHLSFLEVVHSGDEVPVERNAMDFPHRQAAHFQNGGPTGQGLLDPLIDGGLVRTADDVLRVLVAPIHRILQRTKKLGGVLNLVDKGRDGQTSEERIGVFPGASNDESGFQRHLLHVGEKMFHHSGFPALPRPKDRNDFVVSKRSFNDRFNRSFVIPIDNAHGFCLF